MTEEETEALQTSGLHTKTPFLIQGVSMGYFSIARHYGRAKFNGESYTYLAESDELIRDDVKAWLEKRAKRPKRKAKS